MVYGHGKAVGRLYLYASWNGSHPQELLAEYTGYIQSDGYKGVDALFVPRPEAPSPTRVGCWMHVRRKFVAAAETKDPVACAIVLEIQELYRVELEARVKNLADAERLAFRQVYAQLFLTGWTYL